MSRKHRSGMYLFATLAGALAAELCLVPTAWSQQIVKLDGSSTVYPVSEAVAEEFQKAKSGATQVTVGLSGTGGGFKKFCRGETDISDASRPIMKQEMEICNAAGIKYFELPIAFDAITVVVNPKNPVTQLTVAELNTIWKPESQGKVMHWNQVNPAFPAKPLKLFGMGADSGTFDYFTEAVNGTAKAIRNDFTPSQNPNVLVQGVQHDPTALAYFGYAYYAENQKRIKAVAIVDPATGKAVLPSGKAVVDGTYQPLSRPIFIYVKQSSYQNPAIKEFVVYYVNNAARLAKEVKYVPLPERAYRTDLEHLKSGKVGTVFAGIPEVGVRIDDLLSREAKP